MTYQMTQEFFFSVSHFIICFLQTKIRLEMNLEKARQQHIKDTEEKEQEMEELRYSTQKKVGSGLPITFPQPV